MLGERFKKLRINFLLIFLLLTFLKVFNVPDNYDLYLTLILLGAIFVNFFWFLNKRNTNIVINKTSTFILLLSLLILGISSLFKGNVVFFNFIYLYGPFFLIVFYAHLKLLKHGPQYLRQFFLHFIVVLNIFSVLSLYEVIFNEPLFLRFFNEKMYSYQDFAFGTSRFRTISIFGNAIISGIFYVITFISNQYLLKSGALKIILQALILLNIYSTGSRSAWLALFIIFLIMFLNNLPKIEIKKIKLTRNKIFPFYFSFCVFLIILAFALFNLNTIINTIIDRFGDSLSPDSNDLSNVQRVGTIKLILHHFINDTFLHQLFGNGLITVNSFMLQNTVAIRNFGTTDNQYLTWLFEFGLFGIMLILMLLISLFVSFYSREKTEIAKICFYSLIGVLVSIFFFEGISRTWTNIAVISGILVVGLSTKPNFKKSVE